ncbi:hypothetical protein C8A06_0653 [Microbacteriaceae bacterium MWH-Ta3]|nr:hypothetical protein C8A06_0653 [Microbacteriaceae bacterium MWH-Ta3]
MGRSYSNDFAHLTDEAAAAWHRQRDVLDNASRILSDASRLASRYGRDEIMPRARESYESRVAPLVGAGLELGRTLLKKQAPIAPVRKAGLGTFVLAGLGVAAIAAVAYVAWQTLRTDDAAWVDDDFDVD